MSDIHNQREIENLQAEIKRLRAENAEIRKALHCISLGSQDSGTTKEDLGKEARAALEGK
jgi:prefoldin subunit 5